MTETTPPFNPYVGPRPFQEEEADRFFGREREARELVALVVSERLTLFYAQSGAGKSSLINARLIPRLRDQEGFMVLPVGRVSGVLPDDVDPQAVDNIFVYHLILGLSQRLAEKEAQPQTGGERGMPDLAHTSLARFLSGQAGPDTVAEAAVVDTAAAEGLLPHVLIIDQFEELLTTYPDRWQERAGFFEQLSGAMTRHPNLWVVLTLREDYVASLEPYAHLVPNRLRARFYMQRMGIEAAREAVEQPAANAGRPFAAGVAGELVDNLRMVRTAGKVEYHPGEYIEPVQLQVVCFRLWEDLRDKQAATIELADLERLAGGGSLAEYVDRALSDFYERAIARVLETPDIGVTEPALRSWFSEKLITEAGTRSIVFRNEASGETDGLPNRAVDLLVASFLLRTELRAGGAWVELVHDRFVEPIRASNADWFPQHLSTLQRQAALWAEQGRSSGLLLRDAALAEAEAWAASHPEELGSNDVQFLAACRSAHYAALYRERRQNRRIGFLAVAAGVVAVLAVAAAIWAWTASQLAVAARATAEANAALAQEQLDREAGLKLLGEAGWLKAQGDAQGAIQKLLAAQATGTDLRIDVHREIEDVRRQVATDLVKQGEALARAGDFPGAEAKFKEALALEPPPDTPVYIWVPPGDFEMGSDQGDQNELPVHTVTLDGYWIQSTEVTNAQYERCVNARGCTPPDDGNVRYRYTQFAQQPVTGVAWQQAQAYAAWAGGRLPTEAEWEKACRGIDGRTYSWGNQDPAGELLNFSETGLRTWSAVGSYRKGKSPYGVQDMAGNVSEWTADWYEDQYSAQSQVENPTGPATGDFRVLRGGSFSNDKYGVRCAGRSFDNPISWGDYYGFRVVVSPGT